VLVVLDLELWMLGTTSAADAGVLFFVRTGLVPSPWLLRQDALAAGGGGLLWLLCCMVQLAFLSRGMSNTVQPALGGLFCDGPYRTIHTILCPVPLVRLGLRSLKKKKKKQKIPSSPLLLLLLLS
jgi:hypothetical protein